MPRLLVWFIFLLSDALTISCWFNYTLWSLHLLWLYRCWKLNKMCWKMSLKNGPRFFFFKRLLIFHYGHHEFLCCKKYTHANKTFLISTMSINSLLSQIDTKKHVLNAAFGRKFLTRDGIFAEWYKLYPSNTVNLWNRELGTRFSFWNYYLKYKGNSSNIFRMSLGGGFRLLGRNWTHFWRRSHYPTWLWANFH